ncbi:MAG: hypothetical protein D6705_07045 [Deltaproteobacteria bacterium]|nr:MAG: hypothetical protein D6705_07045 [Deltaproteobacteria bacterium]
MSPSVPPRIDRIPPRTRRRPAHGYVRTSDRGRRAPPPPAPSPPRPPAALLPVALVMVATCAVIGWIHVETQSRVLAVAERMARATEIHTRLVERLRLLEAERAYLRHPDRIREVALGRLGLVPPSPDAVHEIVVREDPP